MKPVILLTLIALAGSAFVFMNNNSMETNLRAGSEQVELFQLYTQWKSQYGKNTNGEEDMYRFTVFSQNYKFAEEFNAKHTGSLRLGTNVFADLTVEEFAKLYTTDVQGPRFAESQEIELTGDYPASIDWTTKGAVTAVQDQGHCGSCWAFSTVGGLEGVYEIQTGKLVKMSEQQLVDCATVGNFGCSGGDPMNAYRYASKNGIESEQAYPYFSGNTEHRGECQYNKSKVVYTPSGQVKVSPVNQAEPILEAAAKNPVTIEVAAGNIYFQLYTSGVIDTDKCPTALDHGVLLTGYDTTASTPYWTIKNSWGPNWGNKGYANIAIQEKGKGVCGIQQYAAYPVWNQ